MGDGGEKHSAINCSKSQVHRQKSVHEEECLLLVEKTTEQSDQELYPVDAPIISSYNDRIRPLLDTVDRLRSLNVMKEGIQLPTIVVVGDQSSGKSSVLESLAGISLPRGEGICTRVPLVMRLQQHLGPEPEILLEFKEKVIRTDEHHITEAISIATEEIAGSGKGISDTPLTLHVRKSGVPDLTMIDLPGITRVPVHGQPDNIHDQISRMIMTYIEPEESIILNVLSASVDFSTCESIRMSRQVDKTGSRTLAVVTKADKAPEGLHEKVMSDDVSIGLGYVCVRNRIGDETYEEARKQEEFLFKTHRLLSMIDKDIVGIPVLAQKLMQIQATIIARCLPEIAGKITEKLNNNVQQLTKLPMGISSIVDATKAFMDIVISAKESLWKILVQGDFSEYPDNLDMHCTARLADKLKRFSYDLQVNSPEKAPVTDFLMDEIKVLEECKCIGLPNFLPRSAFLAILRQRMKDIDHMPEDLIRDIWDYVESVALYVLSKHSENFPQIQSSIKRAGRNLIIKAKERSLNRVTEMVETEKQTDYTCQPEYMSYCIEKQTSVQNPFVQSIFDGKSEVWLAEFGTIKVTHLRPYHHLLYQAFDLRMRITVYWKIVLRRIVDNIALHVQFSITNLVGKDLRKEIVSEVVGASGGGIERMLEEPPAIASKRERLKNSIKLLKESKDAVSTVFDRIAVYGD